MTNSYFREIHGNWSYLSGCINFPPHLHDNIEIVVIIDGEGEGEAFCDGEHYFLEAGDLFIAYPNQVHSFTNFDDNVCTFVFMIPQSYLEDYSKYINDKCPVSAKVKLRNPAQMTALMTLGNDCFRNCQNNTPLKYYAGIIFDIVSSQLEFKAMGDTADTVSKTLDYCNENFRHKITLEDISEKLFISRSTVSRIFDKKIGMSFVDYINSLRISEFLRIVQKSDVSITEAATLAGFPTIRTFNVAFKKQHGMTPSEYIKKMKY